MNKSTFGRHAPDDIKAVSRIIGFSLMNQDDAAMWQIAAVIYSRLSPAQRLFLAAGCLWGLTEQEYRDVVKWIEADDLLDCEVAA